MHFHLRLLFFLATIFAISQLASAKKVPHKSHPKQTHQHVAKVVHESRAAAPQGWQRVKKVQPDAPMNLKIALTQQNLDKADVRLSLSSTFTFTFTAMFFL